MTFLKWRQAAVMGPDDGELGPACAGYTWEPAQYLTGLSVRPRLFQVYFSGIDNGSNRVSSYFSGGRSLQLVRVCIPTLV